MRRLPLPTRCSAGANCCGVTTGFARRVLHCPLDHPLVEVVTVLVYLSALEIDLLDAQHQAFQQTQTCLVKPQCHEMGGAPVIRLNVRRTVHGEAGQEGIDLLPRIPRSITKSVHSAPAPPLFPPRPFRFRGRPRSLRSSRFITRTCAPISLFGSEASGIRLSSR